MPLAIPSTPAAWRARLALGFERRGDRTVLARREHDGPLVVQKALHPEGEGVCHAIVVHPPSGLVGGDELRLDVVASPGAHAVLTTPGAGKWYRSTGREASQHVAIDVRSDAIVEWLPQETILFDGTRARIQWRAALAANARLIAWDVFCLGRTGSGESFVDGRCRLETRIEREGRLAWIERGSIAPRGRVAQSHAGLGGASVFGTMVVAAPAIAGDWVAMARGVAPAAGDAGITQLPGLLIARYRGHDTEAARGYFTALWRGLREAVIGRAAVEPRIWRT
jgi:urease accessory protein